jgi:hypothetical protein
MIQGKLVHLHELYMVARLNINGCIPSCKVDINICQKLSQTTTLCLTGLLTRVHDNSCEACFVKPASNRGGPGSVPRQVMWDLWLTKRHWGGLSPSISGFSVNSHSTNCSIFINLPLQCCIISMLTKLEKNILSKLTICIPTQDFFVFLLACRVEFR